MSERKEPRQRQLHVRLLIKILVAILISGLVPLILIVYSAYLGMSSAQQADPRGVPRGRALARYVTELVELLTTRG